MSSRVVVVSDLHIAPANRLDNFHSHHRLAALVRSLCRPGDADTTLVVAGDGFDLLQLPARPRRLDLETAPALVEQLLTAVASDDAGRSLLSALGDFTRAGGRLVFLPGNHDPELFHPDCQPVLARFLDVDPTRLMIDRSGATWTSQVGRWSVLVGHGHRLDPWNDIDPMRVRRALERGRSHLALPPGSLLVVDTLNAFKRALDPDSGQPRFPFIDLLKPESPGVAWLLLYLDPSLAMAHLPALSRHGASTLGRALRQRLRFGPAFGTSGTRGFDPTPSDDERTRSDDDPTAALPIAELLADSLVEAMSPSERAAADMTLQSLEHWFESSGLRGGAAETTTRTLGGGHGNPASRLILRAAARSLGAADEFFDSSRPSSHDAAIIGRELAPGSGPKVVITGHTHAAREIALDEDRVYLNTGTWTDLLALPPALDDAQLATWVTELVAGRLEPIRRLTYAVVDDKGPRLETW